MFPNKILFFEEESCAKVKLFVAVLYLGQAESENLWTKVNTFLQAFVTVCEPLVKQKADKKTVTIRNR